ncbi:MAG: YolD-like family protein [Niallia nealsonii]|uniref:YolD-like family protein n=1 Tax=Niallia circulans TaxID=1397 RepID=A0A941GCR3_NIACI|nr:YolD-like family protein [Niallia circulans]MCB5235597.1 YolD-like family protein [Niallia circulans]MDU1847750.1 YolD-like family protein [Niallia nealsonii]
MGINKLSEGHNLRWESSRMMLPEHREQLLAEKRKQKEFNPPVLDENQLEEINYVIVNSIKQERAIRITYADKYGPADFSGQIQKLDSIEGWLKITNNEQNLSIIFKQILQAEII